MPPKKADPKAKDVAPVIEEKDLSLTLKFVDKTGQSTKLYRARLFSNWIDCCTLTEVEFLIFIFLVMNYMDYT